MRKMHCTHRKRLQLSRLLFLLSGVFLCTLYHLTISARLHKPLPMPQIGEEFGEGSKEGLEEAIVETQELEEPLNATHELEPTDETTPDMVYTDTNSDVKASNSTVSPPSTKTKKKIVHCIYVPPDPPQKAPPPAPSPPRQPNTSPPLADTTPSKSQ